MNLGGILIGLGNIAIFVVLALLIGVLIKYVWEKFVDALPTNAEKLYLALIAIIAIVMLVALLLGSPLHYRFVGDPPPFRVASGPAAVIPVGSSAHLSPVLR